MLSAFIPSELSYPAMHLVVQLVHHRFLQPGPLVLRSTPFKYPPPATDKDRTVSRRSEPSSRTTLMGEQPNPWNVLPLQDVMSRPFPANPNPHWRRPLCSANLRAKRLRVPSRAVTPSDRKSTRLNSSHIPLSRMPSSA